jgi:hypothetical protein
MTGHSCQLGWQEIQDGLTEEFNVQRILSQSCYIYPITCRFTSDVLAHEACMITVLGAGQGNVPLAYKL